MAGESNFLVFCFLEEYNPCGWSQGLEARGREGVLRLGDTWFVPRAGSMVLSSCHPPPDKARPLSPPELLLTGEQALRDPEALPRSLLQLKSTLE